MGFSPMAKANLAEVYRISQRIGAKFYVFHIGQWDDRCATTFQHFMDELGIPKEAVALHSREGEPQEELLRLCNEHEIDLLALGALVREKLFKVLTVSIARDICRKARLSLLLLTQSRVEGVPCERIVVNGLDHPKTATTVKTSLWFGAALGAKELYVVDELSEKELVRPEDDKSVLQGMRKRQHIARKHRLRMEELLSGCEIPEQVMIKDQHVFGKPGYTIAHYAKAQHADLLVVNSPDTNLGWLDRIFKHDLEYILADLPSDLLIVHSTKKSMAHGDA